MKNLEQIRARNALHFAETKGKDAKGQADGDIVKKVPTLILNHGLLAVLGYANDSKHGGERIVCDGIATHLSDPEVAIIPQGTTTQNQLLKYLVSDEADSNVLRIATAEAMAWLNYTRRFVQNKKDN